MIMPACMLMMFTEVKCTMTPLLLITTTITNLHQRKNEKKVWAKVEPDEKDEPSTKNPKKLTHPNSKKMPTEIWSFLKVSKLLLMSFSISDTVQLMLLII